MAVLIVIPARYASTRYPGKPLVELMGAGGEKRSLVRRSWEAAASVGGVDRVDRHRLDADLTQQIEPTRRSRSQNQLAVAYFRVRHAADRRGYLNRKVMRPLLRS